jgi:hypothetical protein
MTDLEVGQREEQLPVKTPRPPERPVNGIDTVGGTNHYNLQEARGDVFVSQLLHNLGFGE